MPLYDVHLRIPVRFKFRNVEAASPEEAISKVDHSDELRGLASEKVMLSWDKGPIEHIEMDESVALSGLVDLVGDDEYLHSVDFESDGEGRFVPFSHTSDIPMGIMEAAAHEAAGSQPPGKGRPAVGILSSTIHTLFGGASADERDMALEDLDHLISALNRAKDAVASIDMRARGDSE